MFYEEIGRKKGSPFATLASGGSGIEPKKWRPKKKNSPLPQLPAEEVEE
jgi:hypothetical protein